jgi:hypothetical protein
MLLMITVLPMHHVVHDLIHHHAAHTHVHHHHHAVLTDGILSLLFIVIGLLQVCHSITVVYHAAHYHAAHYHIQHAAHALCCSLLLQVCHQCITAVLLHH